MVAKIITCLIVLIIHAVVAFFGIAMMLLAMNGYNDAAAEVAIPTYIIAQIIFTIISAIIAFFLVGLFQNKLEWNPIVASLVSIGIALVIVFIMTFIAIGIGIGAGDTVFRQQYPRR